MAEFNASPSDYEYSGMTVNERLFAAGLLDAWEMAARARDRDSMVITLKKVAIGDRDAGRIVDAILSNPTMYGF